MNESQDLLSIYLHIPFCERMCSYCAFNTYTDLNHLIPDFVDALRTEIRYLGERNPGFRVHTIYIGGGTPSILSSEDLGSLLNQIELNFPIVSNPEISIECNPNNITSEYARDLKNQGFNRISLGMQTATNRLLEIYKRDHTIEEVQKAINYLREAQIRNINIDLIFGGPTETLNEWQETLEKTTALQPEHLSLYNLILKGNTQLTKQVKAAKLPKPDDDTDADMYNYATSYLREQGYNQYEISNWCLNGYEAQHNLQYWRNLNYIGLGPGAHGYANKTRTIIRKHPTKYIESLQSTPKNLEFPRSPATSKAIKTDKANEIIETIIMGMRLTQEGIQKNDFEKRFNESIHHQFEKVIQKHKKLGLLTEDETSIRLTEEGRLLSNQVLVDFI